MVEEVATEEAQKLQSTFQVGEDPLTQPGKNCEIIVVNGISFMYTDEGGWQSPPDRVCVTRGHPHFNRWYPKLGVKFGGKVIFDVEEYCVSEGWVRRQMRNARGQVIRERGVARTTTHKGVVEPYWR
jgi:hypothetical protein